MTKTRFDSNGIHLFDRETGLNILFDEIPVPCQLWDAAPRFVSIAITNMCDLRCEYCYAPKSAHSLSLEAVCKWGEELDANGCLGIGLGGGEPTIHAEFFQICENIQCATNLAVSATTHLNRLDEVDLDRLSEVTSFVRVSMDGVGTTYEKLRQRSFVAFESKLRYLASRMRIGLNFVVNDETFDDLDAATQLARGLGVTEFVLLPQVETARVCGISAALEERLQTWISEYSGNPQLSISESGVPVGVAVANPFVSHCRAYAHVDAAGVLKKTSYEASGLQITDAGIMDAYAKLNEEKR